MQERDQDAVNKEKVAAHGDDRADPTPWPVRATVRPEGRWGAVGLWRDAAQLAVGIGILWALTVIAERLRQIVVVLEAQ